MGMTVKHVADSPIFYTLNAVNICICVIIIAPRGYVLQNSLNEEQTSLNSLKRFKSFYSLFKTAQSHTFLNTTPTPKLKIKCAAPEVI